MGILDPYVAYCMDEAVVHLGTKVENQLSQIKDNRDPKITAMQKQEMLQRILGQGPKDEVDPESRGPQQFAQPKATIVVRTPAK